MTAENTTSWFMVCPCNPLDQILRKEYHYFPSPKMRAGWNMHVRRQASCRSRPRTSIKSTHRGSSISGMWPLRTIHVKACYIPAVLTALSPDMSSNKRCVLIPAVSSWDSGCARRLKAGISKIASLVATSLSAKALSSGVFR